MRKSLPEDLEKSCALCEYSRLIETTGQMLCVKSKNIKVTDPEHKCTKFRFDILSYRPLPLRIPRFSDDNLKDFN